MYYLIILSLICLVESKIENLIAGGQLAPIKRFPQSAYLEITCHEKDNNGWICGSSIINQRIILTAAHCVASCWHHNTMSVSVGHNHNQKGTVSSVLTFIIHEKYTPDDVVSDIALIRLKTDLKLGWNVRRVAIMKKPQFKKAQVAGWGLLENEQPTNTLMYIDQYVWKQDRCRQKIEAPEGVICASVKTGTSHLERGDSGGALMVRGYIQIGIASYLMPQVSRTVAMYTDTRYYYTWILNNVKTLYCARTI